jgi:hypothetical protein
MKWLVSVVLVVALVIAGVKWNEHRTQEKREATMYCAMDPGAGGEYSPEFKNCVDQYLD